MSGSTPRYITIDIARAIAIALVVIGHYYEPSMPRAYKALVQVIYMFHMPLFMFISGYLYIATRQYNIRYKDFIAKKFKRLIIPYLSASIIIILIKLATQGFMTVDHPVSPTDFIAMLYSPVAGYFLWFMWALWWAMVIIPLFKSRQSRIILLGISLLLYFSAPWVTKIFCLAQFCSTFIYFVLGTVVADMAQAGRIRKFSLTSQVGSIITFAVLATAFYNTVTAEVLNPATRNIISLLLAVTGISMAFSVSRLLASVLHGYTKQTILSISAASFFIYQYHTTIEGFAKAILHKIHFFDAPLTDLRYTAAIIIVTASGLLIPWFIDRNILSRHPLTRRIFGLTNPTK